MKITLNRENYQNVLAVAEFLKKNDGGEMRIAMAAGRDGMTELKRLMPVLYQLLDYEQFLGIWLENFPFCAVAPDARDHIMCSKKYSGGKIKKCRSCRYFRSCSGFPSGYFKKYGAKEVRPVADLPIEVVIEIESGCNLNCNFCFNRNSFAAGGRPGGLSLKEAKKIIAQTARVGIGVIRFTGGEPLLNKDIFELLDFAKAQGLYVKLNTNGTLIDSSKAGKIKKHVDNVLIPIHSWNDAREKAITGFPGAYSKKIEAIKLLAKEKIPYIRVGTIASPGNIRNFNKIAEVIRGLPINGWEWYRPVTQGGAKNSPRAAKNGLRELADKLIAFREKNPKLKIVIANAIPFCLDADLNRISSISNGALFDEGNSRLIFDPRGFAKPDYFIDENLGKAPDIQGAWNEQFMKKMRNLEFLPGKCRQCKFKFKCRGGSRHAAMMAFGRYDAPDPLMAKSLKKRT